MNDAWSGTLDVRGATIAFGVNPGEGPTVVALHGLGSSRSNDAAAGFFDWRSLAERGRRLVSYDARGHGRSPGASPQDLSWPRLAEDLLHILDVVAPEGAVDAVGTSMGAGTLLHAVIRAPERFRRLALVIPPTAWDTRGTQRSLYLLMADMVEAEGPAALTAAVAAAPAPRLLSEGGWALPPFDVAGDDVVAVLRGSAETDLPDPEALRSIRIPILLLPWIDDPSHPVSTSERLAELIPSATLDVMRSPAQLAALPDRVASFFETTT